MSNKEYTSVLEVENYTLKDVASEYEDVIDDYILAMSRYIDSYTHRTIFDDTPKTLKYDGDGTNLLVIDDFLDISEVTVDGVAVEVLEYPTNKDYTSRIVLDGDIFTKGYQNVSVTGIQAVKKELPKDIQYACTVLVSGIIFNQEANDKDGVTEKIGNYSVTYKTPQQKKDYLVAMDILNSYRRIVL